MPITKHGMCRTRLYRIWNGMKQRCANPKTIGYRYYGGKGVTVCQEWQNSFQAFYDWAMANGYDDHLSIDRMDSNGNYCPENCVWSTSKEQQNNTSYNRLYSYNGETHNIMQWSEITGIHPNMLYKRLLRGWSIEKALTTKALRKWGNNYNEQLQF